DKWRRAKEKGKRKKCFQLRWKRFRLRRYDSVRDDRGQEPRKKAKGKSASGVGGRDLVEDEMTGDKSQGKRQKEKVLPALGEEISSRTGGQGTRAKEKGKRKKCFRYCGKW